MLGTRSSVRKYKQHMWWRRTCVWEWARYTQRGRERERRNNGVIFSISTITITTTLTKGYKVTLYSDCLRATALYTIYRNSLNLGYPKGQCEYGHYTLIFDSIGSIFSPFFAQNRATRYCLLIRVRRFSNFYLHQHNAWGNYRSWVPYSSRVWHRVQWMWCTLCH